MVLNLTVRGMRVSSDSIDRDGCINGQGKLCAVQDQSGTTAYAYDGYGNVARISKTELGVTYLTQYTHDPANRVAAITYPATHDQDGRVVDYTRDAAGRISAVNMTARGTTTALASAITRRADGLPTRIVYGNSLTETRAYSLKGELVDQLLGGETGSYLYDPDSKLLSFASPK